MVHILAQENANTEQKWTQSFIMQDKEGLNTDSKPEKGVKYPQLQRVVIANITCQTGKAVLILNARYCNRTLFDNSAVC